MYSFKSAKIKMRITELAENGFLLQNNFEGKVENRNHKQSYKFFVFPIKLMNKLFPLLIAVILMIISTPAQAVITDANYYIYDGEGNPATLEQILKAANQSDVVFLGEQHDDAVAHFLQAEIFRKVAERFAGDRKVALSLEMFERDVQVVLDEYLKGLITEKKFTDDSRPWSNYKTDYRLLVELAKEKQFPVIAANAPRRYVNMVSRGGKATLEKLSPAAKLWLAELPYPAASAAYAAKFKALMGGSPESNMGLGNILDSQSLWDATMAHSIAEFLKSNKTALVIQLNGSFHSENRLGTVEQLLKYQPTAKITVVTMRYENDFKTFNPQKHGDSGDFVILTDAKVPRSQR